MKKQSLYLLIIYLAIIGAILFSSCSTSKDNRAFRRVVSSPELADKAFKQLEKTRPCISDTTIFIEGKDSIRIDTSILPVFYTDTLIDLQTDTRYITKTQTKLVNKYLIRVDTVKSIDLRRLQLCEDDKNLLVGKVLVLTDNAERERKRGNQWQLAFFGLVATLAAGILLFICIKIFT